MATTNVVSTMEGIFKKRYASRVKYAYPNGIRFTKDIPFDSSKAPGADFNQPVVLQHENGFTLAAPGDGAFTILDPVVGVSKNAIIDGFQIVLSSELDYEAAAKASKAGERAFVRATKHVVKNMTDSHRKMLEIQAVYGQADLGVVSVDGGATQTISAATWSPGIWAGLEGARLDIYDSTLANERTGNDAPGDLVSSIDLTARTVTFGSDPVSTVGDRIFFENAAVVSATPTFKENVGIHKALTTSGAVFGINNTNFNLWKPSSVSAGSGQLLFDHVQEASARVAEKGGIDGNLCLYVSNLTWIDLIGDQAALRQYDGDGSTGAYHTGAESIVFWTATGRVKIVPSIYVKRGFAYLLELNSWTRTGAQDFAFGDPIDNQVFHRLESKAGADMRSYSNVAVFCESLGRNAIINNIVNSAS